MMMMMMMMYDDDDDEDEDDLEGLEQVISSDMVATYWLPLVVALVGTHTVQEVHLQ